MTQEEQMKRLEEDVSLLEEEVDDLQDKLSDADDEIRDLKAHLERAEGVIGEVEKTAYNYAKW